MISPSFVPNIQRFEELDSTNNKMKELARKGMPEGSVIVATRQTQGRGRNGRPWFSPSGGLYLSVLLFPKDPRRATDLSLLAGVAVAQTVKQLLPKSKDISVKWPNDILVDWKKVAGVLCELLPQAGNSVVVGIGINLNCTAADLAPFAANPFSATSFSLETEASEFKTEEVEAVLLNKLFTLYRLYQEEGFSKVQFLWEKNCKMIGKKIELSESGWRDVKSLDGHKVGVTAGTLLGIDETGAILIANAKGERFQYTSGEITCFWP